MGALEDAVLLRNLCCDTFYKKWKSTNSEQDMQTYMNDFFAVERLEIELQDSEITYLIAQSEGISIAYAKIKRNSYGGELGNLKSLEVQRMYVMEEFIGQGIGQQLMSQVLDMARGEKFEVVWLGVWEKNYQAIEFYKRFGFGFYGSHDFVLGEDITTDLLMKKAL